MDTQGFVLTNNCDILVVHFGEESFIPELSPSDEPDGGLSWHEPRFVNDNLWLYPGYRFTLNVGEDDYIELAWNGDGIKHLGGNRDFESWNRKRSIRDSRQGQDLEVLAADGGARSQGPAGGLIDPPDDLGGSSSGHGAGEVLQ